MNDQPVGASHCSQSSTHQSRAREEAVEGQHVSAFAMHCSQSSGTDQSRARKEADECICVRPAKRYSQSNGTNQRRAPEEADRRAIRLPGDRSVAFLHLVRIDARCQDSVLQSWYG